MSAPGSTPPGAPGAAAPQRGERRSVVFADFSRGWGGGQNWHLTIARGLAARGWPVALLARRGGELARRARAEGLPVWPMRLGAHTLADPWHLWRVFQHILHQHPLAVICNSATELKAAGLAARMAQVPRIILRRGIPRPLRNSLFNRLALQFLATRLITNSQATLDAMYGGHPALVAALRPRVQHNGVDPAQWPPPPPRTPAARIVVVGRLTAEKGVDRVIGAMPRVLNQAPQAELHLWGDGEERPALQEMATTLNVDHAVFFHGATQEVRAALLDADLLVLPSRWEGFGFVLVEAMLAGLPTVSFSHTAAREIVVEGETGHLVPEGDLTALAEAIAGLILHPAEAQRMGQAGRLRALTNFTLERALDALEAVLREAP